MTCDSTPKRKKRTDAIIVSISQAELNETSVQIKNKSVVVVRDLSFKYCYKCIKVGTISSETLTKPLCSGWTVFLCIIWSYKNTVLIKG